MNNIIIKIYWLEKCMFPKNNISIWKIVYFESLIILSGILSE